MFAEPELLVSRLLFVGLLIEALEVVALRATFADGGIFSRANLAILTTGTRWHVRLFSSSGASRSVVTAMAIQAAAALVVLAEGLGRPDGIAAAVCCFGTSGYVRSRRQIGGSGAEQLTFIALTAFVLVVIAGGSRQSREAADAFVAAQVILAYLAAGAAKAASPVWRSGRAMTRILSTEGYGIPAVAGVLVTHPLLDRAACWCVIAWEVTFPIVLVAPRPVVVVYLGVGVLFHSSCALAMGLNRFVWAFCGCYPAVWSTTLLLR